MSVTSALILRGRREGRIEPRLDPLREALDALGNPQASFRSVLVVGTNGKGSTAAMLDAIFRSHGLVTGLYTSPHLVSVEERIRWAGAQISARELTDHLQRLAPFPELTYFETLTAAAFSAFAAARVEVAVLEAGMGGSWDATRLAESEIAGLTNVGSDHQRWLGSTREDRARDKGRALQAAKWAVLGAGVDREAAVAADAPDSLLADSLVAVEPSTGHRLSMRFAGTEIAVRLPLAGAFQYENAQLAVALACCAEEAGWMPSIDGKQVRRALESFDWPGRLTTHCIGGRNVLADCAHNLEAAEALAGYLADGNRRFNLLFSCLDDKPVDEMAVILRPLVGDVVVYQLDDERAMPIDRLRAAFPEAATAPDLPCGLAELRDPVLAAGSIRVVGELVAIEEGRG
jgi:dihydrofolate synthase/folylpolyglutamate synthase